VKDLPATYFNRGFHLEDDLDIPNGTKVTISFKQPRNIAYHRKFFKLISVTFKALNEKYSLVYPDAEQLRKSVLIMAGQVDLVWNGKEWIPVPLSLAFDKMDNIKFNEVYNRCLDVCLELSPSIELEIINDFA